MRVEIFTDKKSPGQNQGKMATKLFLSETFNQLIDLNELQRYK
jgi:hypothetical protein